MKHNTQDNLNKTVKNTTELDRSKESLPECTLGRLKNEKLQQKVKKHRGLSLVYIQLKFQELYNLENQYSHRLQLRLFQNYWETPSLRSE